MAASPIYFSNLASDFPIPIQCRPRTQKPAEPMLALCAFFFVFTSSLFIFSLSVYRKLRKTEQKQQTQNDLFELKRSLSETLVKNKPAHESNPTQLPSSPNKLLLEILPSDSAKWSSLFEQSGDPDKAGSGLEVGSVGSGGEEVVKKKKRRGKKKREEDDGGEDVGGKGSSGSGPGLSSRVKEELVCFYPFTSSSSATQRKIKQRYDELMKFHESKKLTLAQVGQFANCLVEARNELQHKGDAIQRKYTITKALLVKAERSSYDRLRQQIWKLELEQKRLEEDASVYNWLQQQLKLSPAYKKMLEIRADMELKAKSEEKLEITEEEFSDISFEELLEQEKKDSFWKKNRKQRQWST